MNLISSAAGRRVVRLGVLILGAAMLIYGAQRGEAATVLSKVVTAILVMPVVAVVVALAGFIGEMIVASIWFAAHGLNNATALAVLVFFGMQ